MASECRRRRSRSRESSAPDSELRSAEDARSGGVQTSPPLDSTFRSEYTEHARVRWFSLLDSEAPSWNAFDGVSRCLESDAVERCIVGKSFCPSEDAILAAEVQLAGSGVDRTNASQFVGSDPNLSDANGWDIVALGVLAGHTGTVCAERERHGHSPIDG